MSARLRGIAHQTQEIVESGYYSASNGRKVVIAAEVSQAREGTRLYGPDAIPVVVDLDRETAFEVTAESSTQAARRLATAAPAPAAVLNFASARNPGGGFLKGAQAQEEALCRASALYATLLRAPAYYEHHRTDRSPFYSDRVIHSPGVPVFRDDRGRFLDVPYTVGFLTSPAPNAGVIAMRTPEETRRVPAALASRAERVLETAAMAGYRRLVLGAWGCGVFLNDPLIVAGAFHALLTGDGRFAGHFDRISFAVLDRSRSQGTLGAFRRVFTDQVAASVPAASQAGG
ncbi:TIGR02452 family protein [Streptomyces albipurpureus]|uniref:TIGR02452 family protein n=1 Tax=Streptomyces albipurpureus TaxID=2897419 RepID=A0ABT0UN59_9ACTN|nr:TIGR02452 family protein [Streptomyces sp. CWNU-1]MCM2389525.1 TIGR02452 family protein [Streptomyces sp. CWNU-1]